MPSRRYTTEQAIEAIENSLSIRQVLSKLGLDEAGGNYSTIRKMIKKLNLDTSHMTGQLWSKGKIIGPKRPLSDYLSNKFSIQSHELRLRLIREKIFPYQCSSCLLKEWLNEPIPLELHHKDGNHENNELINLCLLCPNCHAKTDTHRRCKKSIAKDGIRTHMSITDGRF